MEHFRPLHVMSPGERVREVSVGRKLGYCNNNELRQWLQCEAVCQWCVIMSSVHFINKCHPVPAHGSPSHHDVTGGGSKEVIIILSGDI